MEISYTEKMKNVMQRIYGIADSLDEKGVGKEIPFVDPEEGLRGAIKTDALFCLMRLPDSDEQISPACRTYINECLGYDFGESNLEIVRKKVSQSDIPRISMLLPYFILVDNQFGRNDISSTYVQALCHLAFGYLAEEGQCSINEIVRYYRFGTSQKRY